MLGELQNNITTKLKTIFNRGVLREDHILEALNSLKVALLEADVNYRVVNSFLKAVKGRALGQNIAKHLTASQTFIDIVHSELTNLLSTDKSVEKPRSNSSLKSILLCGLQGSGKTTTAAKLALWLKNKKHNPLLVGLDLFRPAAVEQLKILANQADVDFFSLEDEKDVLTIAQKAQRFAIEKGFTHLILDTQGRLQVDALLMQELVELKTKLRTQESLLVLDSMMGQEAYNVAQKFNTSLDLDGFIITKMDSNSRSGAILSLKAITQKPIKFLTTGEKLADFDIFDPKRIASRILGMSDMLALIEQIKETTSQDEENKINAKMFQNEFDLSDFHKQIQQLDKIGINKMLASLPNIPGMARPNARYDESNQLVLKKMKYVIDSMTLQEKKNPNLLNASRKRRIAQGSGTHVRDINYTLKKFQDFKNISKNFGKPGIKGGIFKKLAHLNQKNFN